MEKNKKIKNISDSSTMSDSSNIVGESSKTSESVNNSQSLSTDNSNITQSNLQNTSSISEENDSTYNEDPIGAETRRYQRLNNTGDEERANQSRRLLRVMRDNLVRRLSKSEDKLPNDHPRTEGLRDKLIRADGHLRGAGLDAVIDDSNFPDSLDSSLAPGADGGDDLGGDC